MATKKISAENLKCGNKSADIIEKFRKENTHRVLILSGNATGWEHMTTDVCCCLVPLPSSFVFSQRTRSKGVPKAKIDWCTISETKA